VRRIQRPLGPLQPAGAVRTGPAEEENESPGWPAIRPLSARSLRRQHEPTHEPAQARQPLTQRRDAPGTLRQGPDLFLRRRDGEVFRVTMAREEGEPAGCHFPIRPTSHNVGPGAQDRVIVVVHDGIGTDLDPILGQGALQSRRIITPTLSLTA
jgi:hypothetical protein